VKGGEARKGGDCCYIVHLYLDREISYRGPARSLEEIVFDLFGKPVFTSSFKRVHCSRNRAGIPVYGLTADVGYRETRFKSDKGAAYFRQSVNATRFRISRGMGRDG